MEKEWREEEKAVTTVIAFHQVDDREAWLTSTKREEFFGPLGIGFRTFVDPETPNRAGLVLEVPDMDAFQTAMQSDQAAEAMKHDGVRADTLVMLVEA
jgi:hypothetical protein